MTTTVKVMIEGNKACEVKVIEPGKPDGPSVVIVPAQIGVRAGTPPAIVQIYGEQSVSVKETGEFL